MLRVFPCFRSIRSKLVSAVAGVFLALFLQAAGVDLPGSSAAGLDETQGAASPGEYVVKFASDGGSVQPIVAGETRDLVFEVLEARTGAPARNAYLEIEVRHLGSRRRLIGTDLPYLEGSRILSTATAVTAGRWVLEDFRFPIRGTYGLSVRAYGAEPEGGQAGQTGQAGVAPLGQDEFKVAVGEAPRKFLWSGILLGGLLLFGSVVGWLYGPEFLGRKRDGSAGTDPGGDRGVRGHTGKGSVGGRDNDKGVFPGAGVRRNEGRVLYSVLALLLLQGLLLASPVYPSGAFTLAHSHVEPSAAGVGPLESAGGRIRMWTFPEEPRMDAPTMVNLEVYGEDGRPLSGALLEVEMVMEEHGQEESMFRLSLLALQGKTSFLYHFPEGEEFTAGISVRPAEPESPTSFEPFEGRAKIGVAPVQPTLARRLKDLALLMVPFFLGFTAMALVQRRRFFARYV